jgi:hypothetical protein
VIDQAELAHLDYLTRARLTQIRTCFASHRSLPVKILFLQGPRVYRASKSPDPLVVTTVEPFKIIDWAVIHPA